ncbi:MAG: hypothetical protein A3K19_05235 [Lentisphaerae bacterium RIFOXYB12_FULL_65_16]|nr:MAG: hypothetical protein A3K18_02605 [Lentisphaerae bacterium RIFOXYA12_64_32]OGV84140.1 MAG: hypothetical protein A3K19_05235 [Lentisphaerae bacterium RIFOXYB12_FULL_65_16]
MKEVIRELVRSSPGTLSAVCLVREYLQARILQALQEHGAFQEWAFVGGTALRFLFSIQRFSEDLVFSTTAPGRGKDFAAAMAAVEAAFRREAYEVSVATKAEKTVASAFLKFPGLPFEVGVSPHRSQVLSVKVEVDTNPPSGAVLATTLTRRHVTLNLVHYDKASLFAGKLHAVLTRRFTKGRDLYDLVWYLADRTWPPPNLELLNTALVQTGWEDPSLTPATWRSQVVTRLDAIDWNAARRDVQPFLMHPPDADLITRENVLGLLQG